MQNRRSLQNWGLNAGPKFEQIMGWADKRYVMSLKKKLGFLGALFPVIDKYIK